MTTQINEFARAAEDFCAWAEGGALPAEIEIRTVVRQLASLYGLALQLPEMSGDEVAEETSQDEWNRVYQRFASLPFKFYTQCFNPHNVPDEQALAADAADDLADIWQDLSEGLSLYKAGHVSAAVWDWRESFWHHWGHHAVGALYASHCWLAGQSGKAS